MSEPVLIVSPGSIGSGITSASVYDPESGDRVFHQELDGHASARLVAAALPAVLEIIYRRKDGELTAVPSLGYFK